MKNLPKILLIFRKLFYSGMLKAIAYISIQKLYFLTFTIETMRKQVCGSVKKMNTKLISVVLFN